MTRDLKSPRALSIGEIIRGRTFRVPLYQRNYKWGKDTAVKLAADLIDSFLKGTTKSIGLLTLHQSEDNEYYMIDGQQRFITLSIIFSLLLSDDENPIKLFFDRDDASEKRFRAIHEEYREDWGGHSTDEDRIMRNKEAIKKALQDGIEAEKILSFAEYILEKCVMLCSVVEAEPEKEFMNLNAYKTRFSVCDHVRANLISLNTFYREALDENNSILASCLEKYSYKTAIACLYDEILDILYSKEMKGTYKNVFYVIKGSYPDPDGTNESRINILFSRENELSDSKNGYFSQEINKNPEEWINMLLKMACAKKLLAQLEQEMQEQNFSSAKEIDDYQKLKKKNFLDLVMDLDVGKERLNTITLARLLKENSNVGHVLMKELGATDLKLANRYFESFVYASINEATVTSAEKNDRDRIELPQMSDDEIISCIQGAGQYVIARFLDEQKQALDASVSIAPVLDLEDRENPIFGGELDLGDDDTIAVRELFTHNFIIPVIQRDYCMGARIAAKKGSDDFLGYLLKNFQEEKDVIASTILVSVEKETNNIYVFDGQQRLYTIYRLLKYCGENFDGNNQKFTFVRRKNRLSKYSEATVDNLKKAFEARIVKNPSEFLRFLYDHVKFKVKVTEKVSAAEQFFMDINGGVPLKSYEIFKSCLCEKLKRLGKEDFIRKLENEWLSWFYRFLDIKNNDESDVEELIEMRFIEFLCRFFIMRRKGIKGLPAFDCIDSKSELVGKLGYINELNENDIENICKVMENLTASEHTIKSAWDKLPIDRHDKYFFTSSYDKRSEKKTYICCYSLKQQDKRNIFIARHKNYIFLQFIHSLSDERRKLLEQYYSWNSIDRLIKLYDSDLLIQDCIRHILGEETEGGIYPYAQKKNIEMRFCGGYHNGIKKWPASIPEEEIPVYYVEPLVGGNYVRANDLYDRVIEKHPELKDKKYMILDFILTNRNTFIIERKNGQSKNTFIAFWRESETTSSLKMIPEEVEEFKWQKIVGDMKSESSRKPEVLTVELTNRTDAYLLKSSDVLSQLKSAGFMCRS